MVPLFELREGRSRRVPTVVLLLLALNLAMFALELLALLGGGEPALSELWRLAFVPRNLALDPASSLFTIGTSMFLHAGLAHLVGNAWFLWLFGPAVEESLGRGRFLALYLLSGLAAALMHYLAAPYSAAPMIGASGAISGVLAAYVSLHPNRRIVTYALFLLVPLPAFFFVAEWFAMNLLHGVGALATASSGVAWWAHIGGFLAGLLLVRTLFPTRQERAERMDRLEHWERGERGERVRRRVALEPRIVSTLSVRDRRGRLLTVTPLRGFPQ